jgi:hypothetical protein
LVIANVGPRHIAIALGERITLFGPNNPGAAGYPDEIQLGQLRAKERPIQRGMHWYESIAGGARRRIGCWGMEAMTQSRYESLGEGMYVDPEYAKAFRALGLTDIEAVFRFEGGVNLSKDNLSRHRSRIRFEIGEPATTLFLKRYDRTPLMGNSAIGWNTGGGSVRPIEIGCRNLRRRDCDAAGGGLGTGAAVRAGSFTTRMLEGGALERRMPEAWGTKGRRPSGGILEGLADFVGGLWDGYAIGICTCRIFFMMRRGGCT